MYMLYKIISSSLILYDCFCLFVRLFVLLFDYLINVLNKKKRKKKSLSISMDKHKSDLHYNTSKK